MSWCSGSFGTRNTRGSPAMMQTGPVIAKRTCVCLRLSLTHSPRPPVMARIADFLLILCLSWVYGTSAFVLIPLHFTNQLQEAAKIIFPTINEIVHKEEVKVPVTLGVMSRCPDALLCETIFDRVLARVSPKVNLSLSFIG